MGNARLTVMEAELHLCYKIFTAVIFQTCKILTFELKIIHLLVVTQWKKTHLLISQGQRFQSSHAPFTQGEKNLKKFKKITHLQR
jgi:hypothetical protein